MLMLPYIIIILRCAAAHARGAVRDDVASVCAAARGRQGFSIRPTCAAVCFRVRYAK